MSDLTATIQRVLQLDREATGGPWTPQTTEQVDGEHVSAAGPEHALTDDEDDNERDNAWDAALLDAALIAEYRTAAPSLARALVAEQGRVADLERQIAAARQDAEALRGLLTRIVRYAREDKAQTPGFTRLARALDEADALLSAPPAPAPAPAPAPTTVCAGSGHPMANPPVASSINAVCPICGKPVMPDAGWITPTHAAPAPAPDLAFGPPDDYRYREARPTTGGAYTIAPSEDNPGAWFWAGPGTAFNYVATEAEAIAAAQAHNRARLAGEG